MKQVAETKQLYHTILKKLILIIESLKEEPSARLQIHGYVHRGGMQMDVSVSNELVDLYGKCSKVRVARQVFDFMGLKNFESWTTMIAAEFAGL